MEKNHDVVIALNEESLVERIVRAQQRVCFVAPGLYDWVAEALVNAGARIGWERIHVIIDPDPHVIQVGYGSEAALKRISVAGGILRKADRLRLGLVITDEKAAVFTPIALNVDEFPKQDFCPNAIELSIREADRIIEAIAPDNKGDESQQLAEIGQKVLNNADFQVLRKVLTEATPVAPDLARQMNVLNSQIQIVKITFEGARLSQHRIPLRADHLGIEDADLIRRISGSFKLFEAEIDQLLAPDREDLERIKKQYDLKPLGRVNTK